MSVIAYGSFRLGGSPGQVAEGRRALQAAIDGGINTIHSSSQYGSFDRLAESLATHPRRGDLHHIVKVVTPDYGHTEFNPAEFRDQVDLALSKLGTERIAVVQHLHRGPAPESSVYDPAGDDVRLPLADSVSDAALEVAADLKSKGKIATIACFPHTIPYAQRALHAGFDGLVHFFGPLEPEAYELFDELDSREMSFIGIRPLLQGLLTDRGVERARLPEEHDLRDRRWDPWYDRIAELRSDMGLEPESWTRFAIRFALTPEVVTTNAIGLDTVEHVETALAAVEEGSLPPDVLEVAHDVVARRSAIPKSTLVAPHVWTVRSLSRAVLRKSRVLAGTLVGHMPRNRSN